MKLYSFLPYNVYLDQKLRVQDHIQATKKKLSVNNILVLLPTSLYLTVGIK